MVATLVCDHVNFDMLRLPETLPPGPRAACGPRDPSSPPPDLVFTYVCNGRTLADVFAPGAEASYVPQFVRLSFL